MTQSDVSLRKTALSIRLSSLVRMLGPEVRAGSFGSTVARLRSASSRSRTTFNTERRCSGASGECGKLTANIWFGRTQQASGDRRCFDCRPTPTGLTPCQRLQPAALSFVRRNERQRALRRKGGREHIGSGEAVHVSPDRQPQEIKHRRSDVNHRRAGQPPGAHGGAEHTHEDGTTESHGGGVGLCEARCPEHFTQNLTLGWDAIPDGEQPRLTVQFSIENLTDNVYLISKESSFVQGQYSSPRMFSGGVKFRF